MLAVTEVPTAAMGCLEFGTQRQVTPEDVERVVELACRVRSNRELRNGQVMYFTVDDARTLTPVGQACERLTVYVSVLS
jgi:cell division ATPase FtsA